MCLFCFYASISTVKFRYLSDVSIDSSLVSVKYTHTGNAFKLNKLCMFPISH